MTKQRTRELQITRARMRDLLAAFLRPDGRASPLTKGDWERRTGSDIRRGEALRAMGCGFLTGEASSSNTGSVTIYELTPKGRAFLEGMT